MKRLSSSGAGLEKHLTKSNGTQGFCTRVETKDHKIDPSYS